MSHLAFRPPEIRFATLTLIAIAALIPIIYLLLPPEDQESTEHVKTFHNYIQSYSTLRAQALTTRLSRGCSHTSLPASPNIPVRKLRPFQTHAETVFSMFSSFEITPLPNQSGDAVHFSPSTSTVIAHCRMGGPLKQDSEMGRQLGLSEWWTEGVLFVKMSGDGKRIEEVREFMHSSKVEEMEGRLGRIVRNGRDTF